MQAIGALSGGPSGSVSVGALPSSPSTANELSPSYQDQQQNRSGTNHQSDIGIDPAIASAGQIFDYIQQLNTLVSGDLMHILQEEGADQDLLECSEQLKACKDRLDDFNSKPVFDAKAMLTEAILTTNSIMDGRKLATSVDASNSKWQKEVEKWKKGAKSAYTKSLRLKAQAAAQVGQSFGDSFDFSVKPSSRTGGADTSTLLKARHEKLLVMQAAMRDALAEMQRTADKQQATQSRAIELTEFMAHLENEQTTLKDIKQFLRCAIDTIVSLQSEVRQLTLFFNFMSNAISITGKGHTNRYLNAIKSGVSGEGVDFGLSYGDIQARMIRDSLLLLRGHFTFVIESSRLYQ